MKIRLKQLERDVRRLAAEQPDRVANGKYVNFDGDSCECILACAMLAQGVPTSYLRLRNRRPIEEILPVTLGDGDWDGLSATRSAANNRRRRWLVLVPKHQDGRYLRNTDRTWAHAVEMADRLVPL